MATDLKVTPDDRPGALAQISGRVAAAGVNINLAYVAPGPRIVIGGDDLEAARRA